MKIRRNLLLAGMGLAIPCYLFAVLNTLLAPWTFLERNRPALALITLLSAFALLGAARCARRHAAFLTRHAGAVRAGVVLAFFAAQVFFGSQMRFSPNSDCAACYYGAIDWVETGRMREYELTWLSTVPNIFPQFVLEVLILRAMRALPLPPGVELYDGVVLFNALCFAAGLWVMLKLAERLRGGAGQAVFAANMALCLPMLYCVSELYSDALSMPFLMLGAGLLSWMLTARRERTAHALALLSGVVLVIGLELRTTVLILVIAAALVAALACAPRRLLCFATVAAVLLAGHAAMIRTRDGILGEQRLARYAMPVSHWLMMGTPDPHGYGNGAFNSDDLLFARRIQDPGERSAACWREFHERLYDLRYPNRMLSALSRKALNIFGDGTYELRQVFSHASRAPQPLKAVLIDDSPEHEAYRYLCTGIQQAQFLFACLGVACQLKDKRALVPDALCAIHLVGLFAFLILWESCQRYFFHAVPVMLAVSALGQLRAANATAKRGRAM